MSNQKTYVMRDSRSDFHKIGKAEDPKIRERTLSYEIPTVYTLIVFDYEIEYQLHLFLNDKKVRGEWFKLNSNDLHLLATASKMNKAKSLEYLFANLPSIVLNTPKDFYHLVLYRLYVNSWSKGKIMTMLGLPEGYLNNATSIRLLSPERILKILHKLGFDYIKSAAYPIVVKQGEYKEDLSSKGYCFNCYYRPLKYSKNISLVRYDFINKKAS